MSETLLFAILAGLFGLLIGSFLNVCIYRLPRDLSVVRPRSFCPGCEHPIAAYDNIPVLSYLLLGGRCRHCKERIPWRYPAVELITGIAWFLATYAEGPTLAAVKLCVFLALLIALVFTDLEERILPDEFTLGGLVIGLVFALFVRVQPSVFILLLGYSWPPQVQSLLEAVLGAAVSSIFLWAFAKVYSKVRHRDGLGFGDVKMVAMIGAFLGFEPTLVTLVLGCAIGSVIGVTYILVARKKAATYELPLGTFLALAAMFVAVRQLQGL